MKLYFLDYIWEVFLYGGEVLNFPKLVLFDLDGTLLDSEPIYEEGWKIALRSHGYGITDEQLKLMVGGTVAYNNSVINSIVNSLSLTEQIREERDQYFLDSLLTRKLRLMAGAEELIDYLHQKVTLALVTSTYSSPKGLAIMETYQIFEKFDYFIFGDDIRRGKPYPDSYLLGLKKANIRSNDALAIEDSITGARSAIQADIKTIVVNKKTEIFHDMERSERIIMKANSLFEVIEWLKNLGLE